jgi:hypothetical protein
MEKPLRMSREIKQIIDEYANERLWYVEFIRDMKLVGEFNKWLAKRSEMMADINAQLRGDK